MGLCTPLARAPEKRRNGCRAEARRDMRGGPPEGSRYKDPPRHCKGRDAGKADMVYIRAQLRPSKGKIQAQGEILRGATSRLRRQRARDSDAGGIGAGRSYEFEEDEMKKMLTILMTIIGLA